MIITSHMTICRKELVMGGKFHKICMTHKKRERTKELEKKGKCDVVYFLSLFSPYSSGKVSDYGGMCGWLCSLFFLLCHFTYASVDSVGVKMEWNKMVGKNVFPFFGFRHVYLAWRWQLMKKSDISTTHTQLNCHFARLLIFFGFYAQLFHMVLPCEYVCGGGHNDGISRIGLSMFCVCVCIYGYFLFFRGDDDWREMKICLSYDADGDDDDWLALFPPFFIIIPPWYLVTWEEQGKKLYSNGMHVCTSKQRERKKASFSFHCFPNALVTSRSSLEKQILFWG